MSPASEKKSEYFLHLLEQELFLLFYFPPLKPELLVFSEQNHQQKVLMVFHRAESQLQVYFFILYQNQNNRWDHVFQDQVTDCHGPTALM